MNMFLARPVVNISEMLDAINVRSSSRQRGTPSGGSDCESRMVESRSRLLLRYSNKGMIYHRWTQRDGGGLPSINTFIE